MLQITISGKTIEELAASATSMAALLNGASTATVAVLSPSEQARLRGDATVVPPNGKEPTAAETKAANAAAKKAAEEAAKAEVEAGDDAGDDPLGENDDDALGEALTHDDVKKLLIEVRGAYPKDATIISTIVKEYGKSAKISDVDAKLLPVVAAHCRTLLAKAKK
jgi:hypothetical protein